MNALQISANLRYVEKCMFGIYASYLRKYEVYDFLK